MNTVYQYRFGVEELSISITGVARVMGYTGDVPVPIQSVIDDCLHQVPRRVQPEAGFKLFDNVAFSKEHLTCDTIVFQPGQVITDILRPSQKLAFFMATSGAGLDMLSKTAGESGDIVAQYIFDIIGSEIAEAAADLVAGKIAELVRSQGLTITNRYSPGYCGWHVEEQQKLFSLFPPAFCGITLNASSLMIPIKSISGVVGIGPAVSRKEHQCSLCEMTGCFRRKNDR